MRALSYIGAEKTTVPPKPDIQTDRHTYRWTDISVYRVASLLKIVEIMFMFYPAKFVFFGGKNSFFFETLKEFYQPP